MKLFPWNDLIKWYTKFGRHDLPWRNYSLETNLLGYHVWLSEVLLQQTQVERVRIYFEKILKSYPTIQALSKASYDEFFPYYQGMGYYSRARNILKTAQKISCEYYGKFPVEKGLLMELPGVGAYTSEAIRAFAYGVPSLAWDTNLEKVFARYYHGRKDDKLSKYEKISIEQDLFEYIGKINNTSGRIQTVRDINNALMDFSAIVDLKNPRNIDWGNYPIITGVFYETRGSLEPQEMKRSQTFPIPDAEILVTLHQDHKIYYNGGDNDSYSHFILPPALHRDTRRFVQEYFREKYQLELSVRPIHRKWITEDGKPYISVNAQIQAGIILFKKYDKKGNKIVE